MKLKNEFSDKLRVFESEYQYELEEKLNYKKAYNKLKEVAERQNKVKTKKNKKNSGGSNQYGSWK